jgi:hypothetical protein
MQGNEPRILDLPERSLVPTPTPSCKLGQEKLNVNNQISIENVNDGKHMLHSSTNSCEQNRILGRTVGCWLYLYNYAVHRYQVGQTDRDASTSCTAGRHRAGSPASLHGTVAVDRCQTSPLRVLRLDHTAMVKITISTRSGRITVNQVWKKYTDWKYLKTGSQEVIWT